MAIGKTKVIVIAAPFAALCLLILMMLMQGDDDLTGQSTEPTDDLAKRLEKFRSVPYTSLTVRQVDTDTAGVLICDSDKAYDGYNLYCSRISPEVFLMDMTGEIVHRWSYPQDKEYLWDHALMLANGDVIVINKFDQLIRLDWDSNLLWRREIQAHHDVTRCPDNTLYVAVGQIEAYRGLRVRFPSIVRLTAGGQEIDRWSAYDHLDDIKRAFDQRSFFDTILDSMLGHKSWLQISERLPQHLKAKKLRNGRILYDYFHLNTISILTRTLLGFEDRRFKAGNLLICFRRVNQIAVLERDTKEILWVWGEGILEWPHHPTMLDNGNILIFDNGVERKYSKIIELNPVSEMIEWEYVGDPPESFYTFEKGSAQRLPNGNTLICEGDRGRVFEITREGEVVWEWVNPVTKKDRRVQVYRMMRLPPEMVEPLIKNA